MIEEHLNYFSGAEKDKMKKFSENRTTFLTPLLTILDKLKISPDMISYLGILLLIPFSIFFTQNILLSVILIWSYVILDGIDGALARYQKNSNNGGAFTDIVCDQLGLIVIVYNLISNKMILPEVGFIYACLYIVMIIFSIVQNYLGVKLQVIIRTKYVIYGLYSLLLFLEFNKIHFSIGELDIDSQYYFNFPMAVFSVIMFITNVISYKRIKEKLSNHKNR